MKNYYSLLFLAILSLNACHKEVRKTNAPLESTGPASSFEETDSSKPPLSQDLVRLEVGTSRDRILIDEKHLHGRFFHDRAEYYVLDNPALFVSDTKVSSLTLYFIDGLLCKKKYQLVSDISSELVQSYGRFKFLPRNERSKEISKSEKIVFLEENNYTINKKLDKYQLKWNDDEGVLIKYRFSKDSAETQITLEEELKDYRYLLVAAENSLVNGI